MIWFNVTNLLILYLVRIWAISLCFWMAPEGLMTVFLWEIQWNFSMDVDVALGLFIKIFWWDKVLSIEKWKWKRESKVPQKKIFSLRKEEYISKAGKIKDKFFGSQGEVLIYPASQIYGIIWRWEFFWDEKKLLDFMN